MNELDSVAPGGRRPMLLELMMLFLVACAAGNGVAVPPANDLCAGAVIIPSAGPFPHLTPVINITEATIVGDPGLPGDYYPSRVARSVWFTFTPAASGSYTLASCAGAGGTGTTADTVMAIYTSAGGCSGPFQILGDLDDETCSPQAALTHGLLADTRYYVLVWKFCEGCTEDGLNTVQLLVTATIPPANDSCQTAVPLALNIPVQGFNTGGSDDYRIVANSTNFTGLDQITTTAAGRDVVYSFTAAETGSYSFKVSGYDALQDVVLYVAAECPVATAGAPVSVAPLAAANRSQVNAAEQIVCVPLAGGKTVFVFVDDASGANSGSAFTLEATRCVREREPNDSPADASPVSCGIEGSISVAQDRDFFALGNFPPGWRAFAVVDGDAARVADFDLRITTFSDTLEYDEGDNDIPFRVNSPNIAGTILPGGPVFAFVNYKSARASDPYRLYAVIQPPLAEATVESEPNNSPGEANFSETGYFYGTLNGSTPSADVDFFTVNLGEGDLLYVGLDGDPHRTNSPINARLDLVDASGQVLLTVNDPNGSSLDSTNVAVGNLLALSPSAPGEAMIYRAAAEGTYFVRISISPGAIGTTASGRYLLSLSKNCRVGSDGLNHAPTLNAVTIGQPAVVGVPVVLSGFVWDVDMGDLLELRVRWGDGSSNVVRYAAAGRSDFAIAHSFMALATNLPVEVTLTDREGLVDSRTLIVQVRAPLQPARFSAVTSLANRSIRLDLEGVPQASYVIEYRSPAGAWQVLGRRTASANGKFSIDDVTPADTSRFYRAISE
jgi:hypothetical protein